MPKGDNDRVCPCYDVKVVRLGNTIYLAMGRVIPRHWRMVRLIPSAQSKTSVTLTIEKMA